MGFVIICRLKLALLALPALLFFAAPLEAQTTALFYNSQAGDTAGGGAQGTLTPADGSFDVGSSTRAVIDIQIYTSAYEYWQLRFEAPGGTDLAPGLYRFTEYASGKTAAAPGMTISGPGYCSSPSGRFLVHEIQFNSSGTLVRFAADFEQYCGSASAGLFGAIRYNSTRASLNPFDGVFPVYALEVTAYTGGNVAGTGINCGAGGTDCSEIYSAATDVTLTATPSAGYSFIGWVGGCQSATSSVTMAVTHTRRCTAVFQPDGIAPADPALGSATLLMVNLGDGTAPATSTLWVGATADFFVSNYPGNAVYVDYRSLEAGSGWLRFRVPGGRLTTGTFEEAYANPSNAFPGLYAGCSGAGQFTVYEVSYDTLDEIQTLAVDFQVHCSASRRYVGSLRYNATRASIIPFDGAYTQQVLRITASAHGTVTGSGIDCGPSTSDCTEQYPIGTAVTLTATPDSGYVLVGWNGHCEGSSTTTVTMNLPQRCEAVFDLAPGESGTHESWLGAHTFVADSRGGPNYTRGRHVLLEDGVMSFNAWGGTAASGPTQIYAQIDEPDGRYWSITFAAGTGSVLTAREFYHAEPTWSGSSGWPYLSVSGSDLGYCTNRLPGRFSIHELSRNVAGEITTFAADFEYVCSTGSLAGAIRYNSGRAVIIPFNALSPASIFSPAAGASLGWPSVTFRWTDGYGVTAYRLEVGTSVGASNIYSGTAGSALSATVPVPAGGNPLYARLWSQIGATWTYVDTTYTTAVASAAYLTSPTWGGVIRNPTVFSWTSGTGPSGYILQVGTTQGGHDIYAGSLTTNLSAKVSGIPMRARTLVWARLWSLINGAYSYSDRWYYTDTFTTLTGGLDVNGDAVSDLLAWNARDGRISALLMNGRTLVDGVPLLPARVTDLHWKPVGGGDFNQDGHFDILWQHDDGWLALWFMQGREEVGDPTYLWPADVPSPDWRVAAVRDLNGDRYPDLVLHNRVTGEIAAWYMNGTRRTEGRWFSDSRVDPAWHVVGAADVNADGKTDLIWQHTDGGIAAWYLNGTTKTGVTYFSPNQLPSGWSVVAVTDLNADYKTDLVLQHTDGRLAVWMFDGTTLIDGAPIVAPVLTDGWRIVGPR